MAHMSVCGGMNIYDTCECLSEWDSVNFSVCVCVWCVCVCVVCVVCVCVCVCVCV